MTNVINGIDHCVILVRDLDAARDRIAALGFTVTPRGLHSDYVGTGNHCVMLRQAYFEVLSVLKPTELNEPWRKLLEVREGLNAVPLASDDAEAARAELAARGLDPSEPLDFSRPVDLPDGPSEAAFRIVLIPEARTPGTSMFVCQHFTREVVWHPTYLDHANGARGVRGVTAVHEHPAEVAPAYEKIFGATAVTADGDATRIDTGAGEIHFLTPAGYAERFPGVTPDPAASAPYLAALSFDVDDRAATQACFHEREVPHSVLAGGSLCVAPAEACGTLFEFV